MIFADDVLTLNAVATFLDASGHATTLDGVPEWSLEGDPIGVVTASEDGLLAVVALNGTLGTAQLCCKADAALSSGLRELALTAEIEIMAGEAVTGSISLTAG